MRYRHRTLLALVVVAAAAVRFAPPIAAQAPAEEPKNYSTWVRQEIAKALAARTADKVIAENGNGVANQKESPSVDTASTSLVDTSSASDFASLALNLTGIRDEDEDKPVSGSVTATLYSLIAAAKGTALTDPDLYKRGTNWRRLSVTLGSEESTEADHFTDKPSTILGAKLLLLNNRDVYSANGQRQLAAADKAVEDFSALELVVTSELQCVIFRAVDPKADRSRTSIDCRDDPAFVTFLASSPFDVKQWPATLATLQKNLPAVQRVNLVINRLATGRAAATEHIVAAVDQIRRGRQLSVAYFTKLREDTGTDEHRAELIFDYGLSERLNWTLNASLDLRDRKQQEDTHAGRFATEFQAKLSNPGSQMWNARPVMFSGSTEATKDPDSDWLIRAQLKLVVPVTTGIDVPVAYTYASRDSEGITSGSQLRFSLAIDPVRLRERFR
jgi:hypothetical protein